MVKILIVDDEPSIRFLVSASLEDEGYDITEAVDGLQAYDIIQKDKPNLIILDVMMPGLTGYELCSRLKNDASTRDILILMLTAKGQENDRLESQQAGADFYLRKPFSPLELIEVVGSLLENQVIAPERGSVR
ncbi:MAG: response regulator receiver protein [Firmicutes bacterium]|nr:response regulator receiver protein [Bacillota bacterium]